MYRVRSVCPCSLQIENLTSLGLAEELVKWWMRQFWLNSISWSRDVDAVVRNLVNVMTLTEARLAMCQNSWNEHFCGVWNHFSLLDISGIFMTPRLAFWFIRTLVTTLVRRLLLLEQWMLPTLKVDGWLPLRTRILAVSRIWNSYLRRMRSWRTSE